jgi:type IX secretion system PorP/SprF family membrane protein
VRVLFIIYLFLPLRFLSQQKPVFSNFLETSVYLNPAIASPLKSNFFINHKIQWSGFIGAPKVFLAGFQKPILLNSTNSTFSNIGTLFLSEKAGVFNSTTFSINYSYSFLCNDRLRCSFGTSLNLQQISVDVTNFNPHQSNDPLINKSRTALLNPDFSLGLLFSNQNNFFGLSANNVLENNWKNLVGSQLSKTESSITLLLGRKFYISSFVFSPTLLLNRYSKSNTLLLLAIDLEYNNLLTLGLSLKNDDAIQSRLKVNLSSKIMITYGYEFYYLSNEINPINSHEFLLTFRSSIVEKLKRSTIVSYF